MALCFFMKFNCGIILDYLDSDLDIYSDCKKKRGSEPLFCFCLNHLI